MIRLTTLLTRFTLLSTVLAAGATAYGQISFQSAISLAVANSPRIKVADDDFKRATAAVSEARDYYIPSLGLGGGLGRSYGISLTVPTIFTVNAQSVVYSAAQRSYIRAAKETLAASRFAREEVRQQIEEDTAITYIALDNERSRHQLLLQERDAASRLVAITSQRASAGIDSDLELKKSRRVLVQLNLQKVELENELAALQLHLTELMGLPAGTIETISASIPNADSLADPGEPREPLPDTPAILASEANTRARMQQALGDHRYAFRPQISMISQYGRISPVNDVSDYYNLNGRYNTMVFGVAIQLPLLDKVHSAHARETQADALHALHEAEYERSQLRENERKLTGSVAELAARVELAQLDSDISDAEFQTTVKEVNTRSGDLTGGRQLNPKDQIYAALDLRQHQISSLETLLQLRRAQLTLMRERGTLDKWLQTGASAGTSAAGHQSSPTGPPSP